MSAPAFSARYEDADESSVWPAPDMTVLGGGRTMAPPFPRDIFGNLWPLITDLAAGAGAPVDYVGAGVLAVAASLIGSKYRAQPSVEYAQWREPCILWVAVVGDPSSNKSPAIDAAVAPLAGMEGDDTEAHKLRLMRHETMCERAKAEHARWKKDVETATKEGLATPPMPAAAVMPDAPQRRRLMVQDSTPEALGEILAGNPMGTFHIRDELAGWLMTFDRYSPGGRELWLEAFGGRPHITDRKSAKEPLRIPFNGVSVLGGIQPEKLADCLLSGSDDGLAARFLWVWPDPLPYQRPARVADAGRLDRLYRRLEGLDSEKDADGRDTPIVLMLERNAFGIFEEWMKEWTRQSTDTASLYKSWCGKLKGMILRLALVSELLEWADGTEEFPSSEIGIRAVTAAISFVEEYAKPAALRVFGDAALPVVERNAAALGRYIKKGRAGTINARDIQRERDLPTLRTADVVGDAIEALVEADWLRPAPTRAGGTTGRVRKDFIVNPVIHGIAA